MGCDEDAKAFRLNARSNKTVFKLLKAIIGAAAIDQRCGKGARARRVSRCVRCDAA